MRFPTQLFCKFRPRQQIFSWTRNNSDVVTTGTKPKPLASIPGPSGLSALPYIGLMFELKPFTNYDVRKLSDLFEKYRELYGPLVKIRVGKAWLVCVYDPDDIAAVFRTESRYPYRGVTPLAKTYDQRKGIRPGLVTLKGEEWYALRSPTQKAMMRPKAMQKYAYRISKIADEFVAKFEHRDRLDNLPDQLMEYTAEGVGMLCFNTRLGCITENNITSELMEQTKTYMKLFGESTYQLPLYTLLRTPMYRQFEQAADSLSRICENYIDEALTQVKNRENVYEAMVQNTELKSSNSQQSLLYADVQTTPHSTNVHTTDIEDSLLFELLSTPSLTPDMIRRILVDVFVAGIDSTANAMTFLFYFLAKHQDKQRKLYQELLNVIPKDGNITEDVIKKLPYLKACVKESFRLVFPICAGTARILDKDIVLQGYKVPKETTLILCNGIICRKERYFPQQDQFLPERWIRGDIRTDVHPFAHLPFGFGPRKCIGHRIADLEIYICTAKMFMTFRFMLPPGVDDIPYKYCTFATPREKTTFMLERRTTTWQL